MIVTLSGASGVGKDTLSDFLFTILPNAVFLPSYTTRPPRKGDRGYVYVSDEEFSGIADKGLFAWVTGPFGNRYGTKISDITTAGTDEKTIWVSIITPVCAKILRSWSDKLGSGKVASIYIYCKDEEIIRKRLTARGDKDIERRINECRSWNDEASKCPFFYWVNNGGELELTKKIIVNTLKDAGFIS